MGSGNASNYAIYRWRHRGPERARDLVNAAQFISAVTRVRRFTRTANSSGFQPLNPPLLPRVAPRKQQHLRDSP